MMSFKTTIYLSILIAVGVVTWIIVQAILANIWLLLIPAFPAIITVAWFVYNWAAVVRERRLLIRAQRLQSEHVIRTDDFGMLHYINLATNYSQNLTLDARTYRNGHYEPPTPQEAETLRYLLASRHAAASKMIIEQPQLPNHTEQPQQLDLLSIFTQATQSYAIIGGQQVGKTFQARRIAQYWLQSGIKPIVVGPKWDRGEWDNCALFGGEYNFDRVSQGMRIVKKLAEDRHTAKIGHKEHTIQPVFFDDWTAIRAKIEDEAEDFIIDATTLYASVNVILYFIIHLDTANAWGVGKVGAALHQNFIKLFVEPGYNSLGLIDRSRTSGYLLMPGQSKKDRRQVQLFSGTGQLIALPELAIPDQISRVCGCSGCSNPVSDNQVYCSNACKQKAYRQRVQ